MDDDAILTNVAHYFHRVYKADTIRLVDHDNTPVLRVPGGQLSGTVFLPTPGSVSALPSDQREREPTYSLIAVIIALALLRVPFTLR